MGWKNSPSQFGIQMLKDADTFTKKVTGEMLQQVVVRSPVDTGQYRNSHRVSVDSDDFSVEVVGSDKGGNGTIQKGIATIQSNGGLGRIVKIQNNQKYALRLENGWSQQAPLGVYSLSFMSVVNKYR